MLSRTEIYESVTNLLENQYLSGSAFVKERNNIMFEKGFGFANRPNEIENNVKTRFNMGTSSKIFTAVAICQLIEKGYFTLDTRVKDCLKYSFPNFSEDITIHQLLTHTSGIGDYFDEDTVEKYHEIWEDKPVYLLNELRDFLELFQNREMIFNPGERFYYNNAGYIILGMIVEEISKIDFYDYIKKYIFRRCGMDESGYFYLDQLPSNTANGYIGNGSSLKTNIYALPIRGGADGGAFSNAPDIVKFWEGLVNNKLLSKEYTDLLLFPHVQYDDNIYYGYGLWIYRKYDFTIKYYLKGKGPGVSVCSSYFPSMELKLSVMANQAEGPEDVINEVEGMIHFPPYLP